MPTSRRCAPTTRTAATSSSTSSRPRSRSRPTSRSISITITVREGQPYTVTGGAARGRLPRQGRGVPRAGADQARRAVPRRGRGRHHAGASPIVSRRYGYAFARVEPRPRSIARPARWRSRCAPSRSGASTCAASTCRATRARATRSCAASSGSSSRRGTTDRKIKLSRDRVDRLGYFKEVSVDTNEVPGSPDQVDLTVNVTEKPTGNLLARR